jgi:hypothetical protein
VAARLFVKAQIMFFEAKGSWGLAVGVLIGHWFRARRLSTFILAVAVLGGCSEVNELRTAPQATKFVASMARGGDVARWRLADSAATVTVRAWRDRFEIRDFGRRIGLRRSPWACTFAEAASELRSIGKFTHGDRRSISLQAGQDGARPAEIRGLLDVVAWLPDSELTIATLAVCR